MQPSSRNRRRHASLPTTPRTASTNYADEDCTIQGHSQGHICFTHTIGFLSEGHYEPDLVSLLLRKAGDVEVNPGPVQTRRQAKASQSGIQSVDLDSKHDKPSNQHKHDKTTNKTNTSTIPDPPKCTTPTHEPPVSDMNAPNVLATPSKTSNTPLVESDFPQTPIAHNQ